MPRALLRLVFCLVLLLVLEGGASMTAAQDRPVWLSAIVWAPSLPEAGSMLAEHLNQIDAACTVDVDVITSTNGPGPEGAVYAFLVTWSCPASPSPSGATWQSNLIWAPTLPDAANGLTDHLNQTDAACRVDVDPIQSTNGAGPEGPVYAFVVAWAC